MIRIREEDFQNARVGDSFITDAGRRWPITRPCDTSNRLLVKIDGETKELAFFHGEILDDNFNAIAELNNNQAYIERF